MWDYFITRYPYAIIYLLKKWHDLACFGECHYHISYISDTSVCEREITSPNPRVHAQLTMTAVLRYCSAMIDRLTRESHDTECLRICNRTITQRISEMYTQKYITIVWS